MVMLPVLQRLDDAYRGVNYRTATSSMPFLYSGVGGGCQSKPLNSCMHTAATPRDGLTDLFALKLHCFDLLCKFVAPMEPGLNF